MYIYIYIYIYIFRGWRSWPKTSRDCVTWLTEVAGHRCQATRSTGITVCCRPVPGAPLSTQSFSRSRSAIGTKARRHASPLGPSSARTARAPSFPPARSRHTPGASTASETSLIRELVSSSVCPCCRTDFVQRIRCLAHLSDSRRPRCRDWVLRNCRRLPPAAVARLDLADRELRRAAQRSGRSHHIARGAARDRSGRVVGRATA